MDAPIQRQNSTSSLSVTVPLMGESGGSAAGSGKSASGSSASSDGGASVGSCASLLAYSSCSISMVLANKALAATYNTDADVLLVALQNLIAVVLVLACRAAGVVEFDPFDSKLALRWLPVDLAFASMLLSGFMALKFLNVPMVTIFKNLANMVIVFGEWHFFDAKLTPGVLGAFAIMVGGATLAARNDLEFTALGYIWQLANCFATAAYVLSMKKATKTIKLSKFGMVFYNNLLSLPLLLPIAYYRGEFSELSTRPDLLSSGFLGLNAFAGSVGFFLNLASLWAVSKNNATTYAIVGSLNKVPVTILGVFFFNAVITAQGATYILISLAGGFIYSAVKLREARLARGG